MKHIRAIFILIQLVCAFALGLVQAAWESKPFPTSHPVRALQFAGPDTGWAVGDSGVVLKTTTGGDTWDSQNIAPDFFGKGVHVLNGRVAWIFGDSVSTREEGTPEGGGTHLFRTLDGGSTWTRMSGYTHEVATGAQVTAPFRFSALSFTNADTGWATLWALSGSFAGAVVLKTHDGGLHWDSLLHWGFGSAGLREFRPTLMLGNSRIIRLGMAYRHLVSTKPVTEEDACFARTSVDKGATWTGNMSCTEVFGATPNAAYHLSGDSAWFLDRQHRIARSIEPDTWTFPLASLTHLNSIHFIGSLGLTTGDIGLMLRTTDAGATWIRQRGVPRGRPSSRGRISFVQLPSTGRAFALLDTDSLLVGDPGVATGIVPDVLGGARSATLRNGVVHFRLAYAARVEWSLTDARGRLLRQGAAVMAPGERMLRVPVEGLAPGHYGLNFRAGGLREAWPLVKNP